MKSWNLYDDDDNGIQFKEIKTKPCNEVEINTESKFFSSDSDWFKHAMNLYTGSLLCIDEESISMNGNYESSQASNLMIVFELCDSSVRWCRS